MFLLSFINRHNHNQQVAHKNRAWLKAYANMLGLTYYVIERV